MKTKPALSWEPSNKKAKTAFGSLHAYTLIIPYDSRITFKHSYSFCDFTTD